MRLLNTALKYKIQRITHTKTQTYNYTQTHTKKSQCKSQRDLSHVENIWKPLQRKS